MSAGRDHAGVAVVGDLVGTQHVLALPDLDMTFGDHQCVLTVVLGGVGGRTPAGLRDPFACEAPPDDLAKLGVSGDG